MGVGAGKQNSEFGVQESLACKLDNTLALDFLYCKLPNVSRIGKLCPFRKHVRKQQHDDQHFSDIDNVETKFKHPYIMKRV